MRVPNYKGMAATGKRPPRNPKRFTPRWEIEVYVRTERHGNRAAEIGLRERLTFKSRAARRAACRVSNSRRPVYVQSIEFTLPPTAWLTGAIQETGMAMGAGLDPAGSVPAGGPEEQGPEKRGIDVRPGMYARFLAYDTWYKVDGVKPTRSGRLVLQCTYKGR